jgi:(p)ppGpp synthase/HD superfamily hydrolase
MRRLEKIIEFVRNAHEGQMRAGGVEPYFNHLERVAQNVSHLSESHQVVAYCHDYLEDVEGANIEALISLGVRAGEVSAIENLTKEKGEIFNQYMIRVNSHPISRVIKASDRADNLLARHPDWNKEKVLRYCNKALTIWQGCSDHKVSELLEQRIITMLKLA